MKVRVFRDYELDIDGVTSVWTWKCPSSDCYFGNVNKGHALFWENAVRGARYHIAWHSQKVR